MATASRRRMQRWRAALVGGALGRSRVLAVGALAAATLAIAALLAPQLLPSVPSLTLGQFTTRAIRAPYDFTVVDEAATARRRQEAAAAVPPAARWDAQIPSGIVDALDAAFDSLAPAYAEAAAVANPPADQVRVRSVARRRAVADRADRDATRLLREQAPNLFAALARLLDRQLTAAEIDLLCELRRTDDLRAAARRLVSDAYAQPITNGLDKLQREIERNQPSGGKAAGGLTLLDNAGKETLALDGRALRSVQSVRNALPERAAELLPELDPGLRRLAVDLVGARLLANLALDENATEARRQAAAQAVLPVSYAFKKNQLIVGEGQPATEQVLLALNRLRRQGMPLETLYHVVGNAFLLFSMLLFSFEAVQLGAPGRSQTSADRRYFVASLLASVLAFRLWMVAADGVAARHPNAPIAALLFLFPAAAPAMTARFLTHFDFALALSAIVAFLCGSLAAQGLPFAGYVLLVSLAGIHAVRRCTRRAEVLRAGGRVALASILGAGGVLTLSGDIARPDAVAALLAAALGGVLSGFAVIAVSPAAEWLFGYVSPFTLLELANYNHPLLRRIMLRSPGTFQHSLNVSVLAEVAASAVHADALLVRTGALYHDAGKSESPAAFAENQSGDNLHDALPPQESVRLIRQHVVDGVSLLREFGVGERLADFVREHHGDGEIRYFLDKARRLGLNPDPRDFRYDGPRPRSKETGILMIADQVEATSRTLGSKTDAAFREMTVRTIDRIVESGQLDQCPLTVQDLAAVREALVNALGGVHHNRVRYPGQPTPAPDSSGAPVPLAAIGGRRHG